MRKTLIIHPYFGSHYKAFIYSELNKAFEKEKTQEFKVIQIFGSEDSRKNMESQEEEIHNYPFEILFQNENVTFSQKLLKLLKAVLKYKPTNINVSGYYDWSSNIVLILCKLLGIRTFMSVDSTMDDQANSLFKNLVKRFILFWVDGFFAYGGKSAQLITSLGRKEGAVLMKRNAVPNAVIQKIYQEEKSKNDQQGHHSTYPPFNFIYVGRLIKEKNVDLLIRAFEELKLHNCGLIIIGTGVEETNLRKLAPQSKIFFEGGKTWREVPKYLAKAHCLVLPSSSEPWGLVVNEAMACGLPVIVSHKCGCAFDLVEGKETGIIFENGNVNALKEALIFVSKNPEKGQKMGTTGTKLIEQYTPEQVALEMWKGFQKFA